MDIIIQAGGMGSRLESLTWNRPKCLVSINGRPLIFYFFQKFPEANFYIIADYKADVLKRYLHIFAENYKITIIQSKEKGTASGIKKALKLIPDDNPLLLVWSDLIPAADFQLPAPDKNYIGIANSFECRWSFIDNKFEKCASAKDGVAGCFFFKDKSPLKNIPSKGEFVAWLKDQTVDFDRMTLHGWKEIGTILAFKENSMQNICRPFNEMQMSADKVIKKGKDEYGKKIGEYEISWYRHVKKMKYPHIPKIFSYSPLTMQKITGHNICELDCLVPSQKEIILSNIITALQKLHLLESQQPVNLQDVQETYFFKTFRRLKSIRELVPFAKKTFLRINNRYYRNVFTMEEEIFDMIQKNFPSAFCLIHGDCTFSNVIYDTFNSQAVLIDPRGYFGNTRFYGDEDYDWAKLYYSLYGNYDQFNRKMFSMKIGSNNVELVIKSSDWECMENFFFDQITNTKRQKIKLLHALIWLSLTTYAWDDYDSICGAFYNGIIQLGEVLP